MRLCWVNFKCRGILLIWIVVKARAYCACSRRGWGLFGHFLSHLSFSLLSPLLGDGSILTEILSQRAVKPPNNQPILFRIALQRAELVLFCLVCCFFFSFGV